MPSTRELLARKCQHTETALADTELAAYLAAVPGWEAAGNRIVKTYKFKNYYETLAFMNAIAYVIHVEDHHPEITLTYQQCVIKFDTHSVNGGRGGLSENDFICAAKVETVFQQSFS
ncbi:4a-hydroxytetrahydrobiopterin dehydratase [Solimicrobium silvestre]|uniref:Putative pterin-4-alpha-carbinolamine dehydratase n=1 Tax=Solimicrobium silvestre TaxID=2099400 RepID=A0A2S9GWD2_9BURK|nr:4a-hydroxytetrahydrobiopterin dehydratase [Solimicrobium silvestre]PRC92024.1 Pterin-4a-carbinolamine dehydratase [Solimicrobium silvestre]